MPVRKASFWLVVALISSILYLVIHYITNLIYGIVGQPYMDEIFHIPQAKRYCQGNFTYYDPKLTTPPGLYILSFLGIYLRDKVLIRRSELICDTLDLRRTNQIVTIFNFVILVLIQLSSSNGSMSNKAAAGLTRRSGFKKRISYTLDHSTTLDLAKIVLSSIIIILLPPLFFFNSLYYTDAASLLFILLTYLFSVNDQHLLASLSGMSSIFFRQTNIVWVFYCACLVVIKTIEERDNTTTSSSSNSNCCYNFIFNQRLIVNLVRRCIFYSLVGILFISFVVVNKGIVLGDRKAHQPKLHLAQILYYLGFCSVFGACWIFHPRILKRFLYFTIRSPITAIVAIALIIYLISFGRYAHPYLLADNRHLTFYIWRRVLDRHNSYVPYLLTPVYLISTLSVWQHLRAKNNGKQMLLYVFCTMLVTIPNGLLEPRYFIIPYIFLRLSVESSLMNLLIEICQNLAINMGMYYLFMYKTFRWSDSPEVQRIMW